MHITQIQVRAEEHLIIRSWFVVLLLCDECTLKICHAQSQRSRWSQSKEGTLWTRFSFTLEFIHVQLILFGGVYTFVSSRFMKSASKKWVYRPAFQCLLRLYLSKRSLLLREIWEPVWSYIIDHCSSFVARDCNAYLSQIFEWRTFGIMHVEEESLFTTFRTFNSFCSKCANPDFE